MRVRLVGGLEGLDFNIPGEGRHHAQWEWEATAVDGATCPTHQGWNALPREGEGRGVPYIRPADSFHSVGRFRWKRRLFPSQRGGERRFRWSFPRLQEVRVPIYGSDGASPSRRSEFESAQITRAGLRDPSKDW